MTPPRRRTSDRANSHPVWRFFNESLVKAFPAIIVTCTIIITGGAVTTYIGVIKLTDTVTRHEAEISALKQELRIVELHLARNHAR